jgi:hypothetical protein
LTDNESGNGTQNANGERSNLRDLGQPTGSQQKRRRAEWQ